MARPLFDSVGLRVMCLLLSFYPRRPRLRQMRRGDRVVEGEASACLLLGVGVTRRSRQDGERTNVAQGWGCVG